MSIAARATCEDKLLARALIASATIHALAFYALGDIQPRTRVDQDTLPLEVRFLMPRVEEKLAAAPAPVRPQPQVQPQARTSVPQVQRTQAAPPRPPQVARAPADESHPPTTPTAAAAPTADADLSPAPTEPAIAAAAATPPEVPPRLSEPASDRLALQARYGRDIEGAVDAAKSYPRIARERGWQGTVKVRLRFLPGGSLDRIDVVDSSGFPLLDEHAVKMARSAELPRVPSALAAVAFELSVPIHFRLRS